MDTQYIESWCKDLIQIHIPCLGPALLYEEPALVPLMFLNHTTPFIGLNVWNKFGVSKCKGGGEIISDPKEILKKEYK